MQNKFTTMERFLSVEKAISDVKMALSYDKILYLASIIKSQFLDK